MLARVVLTLAVVATGAAARAQVAEPPPSPSVAPAPPPPAAPAEPPTVAPPAPPAAAATPAANDGAESKGTPTETPATTPTATTTATATPTPTTTATATATYEPYSPSQMTWGAQPAAQGATDPSGAFTSYRGHEWGLGFLAADGAGDVEVSLLFDLDRFALGVAAAFGGSNGAPGMGFLLVGGPRVRLSPKTRLDLLADAGLTVYGNDGKDTGFGGSTENSGSRQVLGTAGLRAGVTFTADSGWYLSLGAGLRFVPETEVTYTRTECPLLGACKTSTRQATYGGTIAGGFLTFGRAYPRSP